MDDAHSSLSPFEQEWRTRVTAINAAAEILRDYPCLHEAERDRFIAVILEESDRLRRTFEHAYKLPALLPHHSSMLPLHS